MVISTIQTFLGHLHPLLVHLPIGFLITGIIFEILSYRKDLHFLKETSSLILLLSAVSASISCLLGFLLSASDDYDPDILTNHKLGGILLSLLCFIIWALQKKWLSSIITIPKKLLTSLYFLIIFLLLYVGHQGGNLTHGSDYLSFEILTKKERIPPKSMDVALMYEDVIQAILEKKCVQCHNKSKLKGNLNLSSLSAIKKGGKHGAILTAGFPEKSEIIRRIELNETDKEFMPTDGKTPLTNKEIEILEYWIKSGNITENQQLSTLKLPKEINDLIAGHLGFLNEKSSNNELQTQVKTAVDQKYLDQLRKAGFSVRVMYQNPTLLDIRLMLAEDKISPDLVFEKLKLLTPVAQNIIWLNLSGLYLKNEQLQVLKQMENLEKLRLDKNDIDDEIASYVRNLNYLNSLNLNQTKVTSKVLKELYGMPGLKTVYLFQTNVKTPDTLKSSLPKLILFKIL